MKKLQFISFLFIIFTSCQINPTQSLVGEWKEYYGIGEETDVTYNSIYRIEISKNDKLIIECSSDDHTVFDNIVFDGNELSFRKENTIQPNVKFYMYGKLKLKKNEKWMEGDVINSKNEKSHIKWEKIK